MKPVVDAKEVLDDIRSGMSDAGLMAKYRLSPIGLDLLIRELMALGAIRQVSAKDLLRDIRSGKTNDELMEKYELSPQALTKLFNEMMDAGIVFFKHREQAREKKRINVRDIEADIRSGATESQLMNKYGLSSRGLQSAFWKLVDSGIVTWDELLRVYPEIDDSVTLQRVRSWTRGYPILSLVLYEEGNPQNRGKIKDLSERGFGLIGFRAQPGERKKLVLTPDDVTDVKPFSLVAECRWFKPGSASEACSAGFQITRIHGDAVTRLQELVELTTLTFE